MFSHVAVAIHANYASINSKQTKSFHCFFTGTSHFLCARGFLPGKKLVSCCFMWKSKRKAMQRRLELKHCKTL